MWKAEPYLVQVLYQGPGNPIGRFLLEEKAKARRGQEGRCPSRKEGQDRVPDGRPLLRDQEVSFSEDFRGRGLLLGCDGPLRLSKKCALQGMRGPAKNSRPAPPHGAGRGTISTEQGGAGRPFGPPGHIPVLGPRPVHRVFLTVSTVLFTVATVFFTVAMVFFAPYVNFRRILSS